MRNSVRYLFATLFVLFSLKSASAQNMEQAARHFSSAQAAYQKGFYRHAARDFQAAYDASHDALLLYNVAEAWQRGGEGRKAADAYRAYLKAEPAAVDRKEVERRIRVLEETRYEAKNQSLPGDDPRSGAPAVVPARPTTPAPDLMQPRGFATAPTGEPGKQAGDAGTPMLTPEAVAATTVSTTVPQEAPKSPSKMRIAAWVGVAGTVAFVTAGAIFSLAAQSRADEISRRLTFVDATGQPRPFDAAQQAEYNNLKSEGNLYNGLGIGFFAAGGAMAVVSTVLFIVDYKKNHATQATSYRPTLGFGGTPGQSQLLLTGRF